MPAAFARTEFSSLFADAERLLQEWQRLGLLAAGDLAIDDIEFIKIDPERAERECQPPCSLDTSSTSIEWHTDPPDERSTGTLIAKLWLVLDKSTAPHLRVHSNLNVRPRGSSTPPDAEDCVVVLDPGDVLFFDLSVPHRSQDMKTRRIAAQLDVVARERNAGRANQSGGAVLAVGAAALDVEDWRSCLPRDGSALYVYALHESDGARPSAINRSCLLDHHIAHHGSNFVPRLPDVDPRYRLPSADSGGCSSHQGNGLPFGEQRQAVTAVHETDGCLDAATFLRDYVRWSRPVIMRGCNSSHQAHTRWQNASYLRTVASELKDHGGQPEANPTLGGWLASEHTAYFNTHLDDVGRDARPSTLKADLHFPPPLLGNVNAMLYHELTFWLNNGGHQSRLHVDGHDALFLQVEGRKEFVMVDPMDSHKLYMDFPRDDTGGINFGKFGESPINVRAVDLCAFPQAKYARISKLTLNAGDALYIPPMWWHVVHSLKDAPPLQHEGQPARKWNVAVAMASVFLRREAEGRVPKRIMSSAAIERRVARVRGCPELAPLKTLTLGCDPLIPADATSDDIFAPLAAHLAPVRMDCVRSPLRAALDGNDLFGYQVGLSAQYPVAEFAAHAFHRRGNVSDCQTWAPLSGHTTHWSFDDISEDALVVSGLTDEIFTGASVVQSPAAELHMRCGSLASLVEGIQAWLDMEASTSSRAFFSPQTTKCHVDSSSLDCHTDAEGPRCYAQQAERALAELISMMYAFWGVLHT